MKDKSSRLFLILGGFFVTNALLAEFIGVKIFSVEETLGFSPLSFSLFGFDVSGFNMTAGVLLWPVVFVMTDIINEYYGKKGVRILSYMTAILIAYAFLMVFVAMKVAPNDFWITSKTSEGVDSMHSAFNAIFGQGLRIIVGSLVAFLIGQFVDVYAFRYLRKLTGKRMIWLRATGSTLISQFIDSFVVLFIAFSGTWSFQQILALGMAAYIYKFIVAILSTPVIYGVHFLVERYLGIERAEELAENAD